MYCPRCGAENAEGKRYCGDCGAVISANAEAQSRESSKKPLTMRQVYMRQWMWGCLYAGAMSLIGGVVWAVAAGEPALGILMALLGLVMLIVGIALLKQYGTGWNE